MFTRHIGLLAATLLVGSLAQAATVNYSGVLQETAAPANLSDDFVIAGTFKPGFDVNTYEYAFGDPGGNLHPGHYAAAVSSGTFRPIGPGTLANAAGAFNGSGTTTGIDNLPIYLFLFDSTNPDGPYPHGIQFLALITGTDSSWKVQADGTTSIDASTASFIKYGSKGQGTIQLGIAPFPEPAAITAVAVGAIVMIRRQRS